MYPTSETFSQLVTDGETEQDLIIVFDNGTVLNSKYGDMVAGSASLTEYAFANTDVTYGECLSSEFAVTIPQSVMDANTVDGLARPFIAVNIGDKYTVIPSGESATIGYGPTAWTVDGYGGFHGPNDTETILPAPWAVSTVISLPGGGTATPHGYWNTFDRVFVYITETQIISYYRDFYNYPSRFITTIENGTYDSDGHFIPPATADGNYTTTMEYNPSGHPYIYTRDGETTYYEMCPLGHFNFDSMDAVEGVTTEFVCQDKLAAFDVDITDYLQSYFILAGFPLPFGNFVDGVGYGVGLATGGTYAMDSVCKAWLNSIGDIQAWPDLGTKITARDALNYVAAVAGCNFRMTREGQIGITRFIKPRRSHYSLSTTVPTTATPVDIDCTRVVAGSSMRRRYTSTAISGLNVYAADGTPTLYGDDTNAVFDLNYNPFMKGQTSTFYGTYLTDLASLPIYKPHTVSIAEADPSVVAGDMFFVEYEEGQTLLFPLMSQTLHFGGRTTADYVTTASRYRAENRESSNAGSSYATTYDLQNATKDKVPFMGEESSDLDNCTEPGFYDYLAAAGNNPVTGAGGALIVIDGPSPYIMQYALPRDSSGASTAYVRQYTSGGTWGAWAQLLTEAPAPTWTDITSSALTVADTSKATIDHLKLYSCGNMRLLQGYVTAVNLPTTQTTVANISSGNRPADQVAVSCAWDSARYVTWGIVGAGGAIAIRSSSAYTSGNLRLNAMWLV